ncbi:MAG: hypothetical protein M1816_001786 [Peltula sp. TS41687]|nr:MAG: hypothetical protein M1816_001786 [Peltula sp. TS41687]
MAQQHSVDSGTKQSSTLPFPLMQNSDPNASAQLITQGAEALLYRTTYLLPTIPCALKYRPRKPYRHPTLDARLTRHRILAEARVLVKCRREGLIVPAVYLVDWESGWLMMEWIEGSSVRDVLHYWLGTRMTAREDGDVKDGLVELMSRIGRTVGKMHAAGVIHGDLTTSNFMLRPASSAGPGGLGDSELTTNDSTEVHHATETLSSGDVVLIDFGLANQSVQDEDRAVDLYVLERAFGSTHPKAEGLFEDVLKAYGGSFRGAKVVLRRLEDVRLRGRKKSMIG